MAILDAVQDTADRIEQAYLRRRPPWNPGYANPRIWSTAAAILVQLHERDPSIPIDPELYVLSQPPAGALTDPWEDLTQPSAVSRYLRTIRQIVARLRRELRAEVRAAEDRLGRGEAAEAVLGVLGRRLSALGRYVVAQRAGRPELAERFRIPAREQHRACPLYREACRGLLDPQLYPDDTSAARGYCLVRPFSLN